MYIRHSKSLLYTARGQVVGSQPAVVTQCRLRIWIFLFFMQRCLTSLKMLHSYIKKIVILLQPAGKTGCEESWCVCENIM